MSIIKKIGVMLTTVVLFYGCSKNEASTSSGGSGKGGSLARFAVAKNHLYVVEDRSIKVFNYSNPLDVKSVGTYFIDINTELETIFPYKNNLFVGGRDGMFIYDITNPSTPTLVGRATHLRSCDPVVANDTVSFVTLRGGTACGTASPGLYVYDVKDIKTPTQKNYTALPNPFGLGLHNNTLYVCLADSGMQVLDVTNAYNPILKKRIKNEVFKDVIVYNNVLFAFVSTGTSIYDITNATDPVKLGFVAN